MKMKRFGFLTGVAALAVVFAASMVYAGPGVQIKGLPTSSDLDVDGSLEAVTGKKIEVDYKSDKPSVKIKAEVEQLDGKYKVDCRGDENTGDDGLDVLIFKDRIRFTDLDCTVDPPAGPKVSYSPARAIIEIDFTTAPDYGFVGLDLTQTFLGRELLGDITDWKIQ